MDAKLLEEQVLALAGVAQVARLVDQISRTGSYPTEFLGPVINSLFVFDPGSTAEVYGGTANVKLGLQNLANLLANQDSAESRDMVRYVFSLLYLERKFAANPEMMAVVHSRLEHTQFKADHFSNHMHEVCHSLAAIYQDSLSTFKYRIKVTGSMQQLQDPTNADIIRALLLAGVRSAFLWRQLGGRRWKLLLQRKSLRRIAQNLSRDLEVV
jgi:high frequency lysogenization protein